MPKLISFIILSAVLSSSCAQSPRDEVYSRAMEDTIHMVVTVLIQDSVNTWDIKERMKTKSINGVSIAVIHDYKIAYRFYLLQGFVLF